MYACMSVGGSMLDSCRKNLPTEKKVITRHARIVVISTR